jgi:hypothetical protein
MKTTTLAFLSIDTSLFFCVILLVMVNGCTKPPQTEPELNKISLFPSTIETMLDDTFTIDVLCDTTQEFRAYAFELHYNPQAIQPINITVGAIWKDNPDVFLSPIINNNNGTISNIFAILLGDYSLHKSGSLATITFITDGAGTTNIELTNVHLYNATNELPINLDKDATIIIH